jgi:hypothetical protein
MCGGKERKTKNLSGFCPKKRDRMDNILRREGR